MKLVHIRAAFLIVLIAPVLQSAAKMRQLPPSAFLELPPGLLQELQLRGCQLPQDRKTKHSNVIQGDFLLPRQIVWAVLCATKKTTTLLVLEPGSPAAPIEVETRQNNYSNWTIHRVSRQEFRPDWGWTVQEPSQIDHAGVHSYLEYGTPKAGHPYDFSAEGKVLYFNEGQWLKVGTVIVN